MRLQITDFERFRILGGLLMGLVGVLYLLFEKSILSTPRSDRTSTTALDSLSKNILGAQIGLIVLAMVVTKSSVTSIQAKQGLPLGNQVVGWIVLGTQCPYSYWTRTLC